MLKPEVERKIMPPLLSTTPYRARAFTLGIGRWSCPDLLGQCEYHITMPEELSSAAVSLATVCRVWMDAGSFLQTNS